MAKGALAATTITTTTVLHRPVQVLRRILPLPVVMVSPHKEAETIEAAAVTTILAAVVKTTSQEAIEQILLQADQITMLGIQSFKGNRESHMT